MRRSRGKVSASSSRRLSTSQSAASGGPGALHRQDPPADRVGVERAGRAHGAGEERVDVLGGGDEEHGRDEVEPEGVGGEARHQVGQALAGELALGPEAGSQPRRMRSRRAAAAPVTSAVARAEPSSRARMPWWRITAGPRRSPGRCAARPRSARRGGRRGRGRARRRRPCAPRARSLEQREQLFGQRPVQVGARLVGDEDRAGRSPARGRSPRAAAPRPRAARRAVAARSASPKRSSSSIPARRASRAKPHRQRVEGDQDVLQRREAAHEVELLEDEAEDPAAQQREVVFGEPGDLLPEHAHAAGGSGGPCSRRRRAGCSCPSRSGRARRAPRPRGPRRDPVERRDLVGTAAVVDARDALGGDGDLHAATPSGRCRGRSRRSSTTGRRSPRHTGRR